MTCKAREDSIFLHAADALDDDDARQELVSHLRSGCSECLAVFDEAHALLARLPEALEPVAPPNAALGRLMRRVAADQARSGGSAWRIAAIAASIGLIIGAVSLHLLTDGNRQETRSRLAQLDSMLASEKLKYVSFTAPDNTQAAGRIFWDQDAQRWHVFVFDLKPPPPGRTYELWFITDKQTKVAAGTFDPDRDGKATKVVQVPQNIGPIVMAAVTDEPLGGLEQPTGSIHLVGKIE